LQFMWHINVVEKSVTAHPVIV